MDERAELIERWKLAYAEHRAEVTLGWDRSKTFLALNPVLTAGLASFAKAPSLARLALAAAAVTALGAALIVYRGHTRYRAARAAVQALEDQLGFADLQTTGGQRAARDGLRLESFKVMHVVCGIFVLNALLDLAIALSY